MDGRELVTRSFRAMNTDVEVSLSVGYNETAVFDEVADWFEYAEEVFSRFRPDSELSVLNRSAGKPSRISRTMEEVLKLARRCQDMTEGMFRPGILPQLIQAGYSSSFEKLPEAGSEREGAAERGDKPWNANRQEPRGWTLFGPLQAVRLDKKAQIDLGGIVKGWAVDRMADRLIGMGIPAGLLNAGGDLRVWGGAMDPDWEIDVADPRQPDLSLGTVRLGSGAVATSSVLGRSWHTAQGRRHHLIDPRTGEPSDSDVLQCTVSGTRTAKAEVAAKTVCMMGSEAGLSWLARAMPDCDALLLTRDGSVQLHKSRSAQAERQ